MAVGRLLVGQCHGQPQETRKGFGRRRQESLGGQGKLKGAMPNLTWSSMTRAAGPRTSRTMARTLCTFRRATWTTFSRRTRWRTPWPLTSRSGSKSRTLGSTAVLSTTVTSRKIPREGRRQGAWRKRKAQAGQARSRQASLRGARLAAKWGIGLENVVSAPLLKLRHPVPLLPRPQARRGLPSTGGPATTQALPRRPS